MEGESATPSNWLMSIKLTLNAIGLSNIYDRPWCFSTYYIARVCKQNFSNYFSEYWKSEIKLADVDSVRYRKTRTYKLFSSDLRI